MNLWKYKLGHRSDTAVDGAVVAVSVGVFVNCPRITFYVSACREFTVGKRNIKFRRVDNRTADRQRDCRALSVGWSDHNITAAAAQNRGVHRYGQQQFFVSPHYKRCSKRLCHIFILDRIGKAFRHGDAVDGKRRGTFGVADVVFFIHAGLADAEILQRAVADDVETCRCHREVRLIGINIHPAAVAARPRDVFPYVET